MAPRSWITPDFDIAAADRLAAELDLPKPLAGILVKREISDPAAARKFLNPNFRDLVPPDALPGVSDAVRLIWNGIRSNAHFVVFGDFDTDGVCSTAIMVRILRLLGARADHFLPQRQTEGYGLTPAAIGRCRAECGDPDFWITVDFGNTAGGEGAAHLGHDVLQSATVAADEDGAGRADRPDVARNPGAVAISLRGGGGVQTGASLG